MIEPPELRPVVHVRPARARTRGVVLVLHGGQENSVAPSEPLHLARRRMVPFARALERHGAGHGVAVWSLGYRVRGWNGEAMSPVHDARWALDEVRARQGDVPVVLLGHSMGGRAAAAVLGDPSVVGMVGLAPWLPGDTPRGAAGRRVLVAHGTRDRTTSAREALEWSERARAAGAEVTFAHLVGCGHFLLRRVRLWTDLATGFALGVLGVPAPVRAEARQVLDSPGGTLRI